MIRAYDHRLCHLKDRDLYKQFFSLSDCSFSFYFIMALPRTHQASFTPSEIEFIAGDEKIKIIPKVKLPRMSFIQVKSTR